MVRLIYTCRKVKCSDDATDVEPTVLIGTEGPTMLSSASEVEVEDENTTGVGEDRERRRNDSDGDGDD